MRRMWHTMLMMIFGALLIGCGGPGIADVERAERGSALYRKAIAAEQSGDIDEAVRLFNKVLIEEPRSFSAHFQLATLLQDHAEDYFGAIYHYKQYLALRPESEKSTLAQDRIRIAEQRLAPQILKKVGDSVQGLTQAHLLKENERLNLAITSLQGEKSMLLEERAKFDKELTDLRADNERLRDLLRKMRVSEADETATVVPSAREAATVARQGNDTLTPSSDAKQLRALREEAEALAREGGQPPPPVRRPPTDMPSTESVLKKVEARITGTQTQVREEPRVSAREAAREARSPAKTEKPAQTAKPAQTVNPAQTAKPVQTTKPAQTVKPAQTGGEVAKEEEESPDFSSALSFFGRNQKKDKTASAAKNPRTYVVQPGDTLFRVAERFYGDATQWKRIREANRTRIDPDGRIRAGQIIVVP
ncbi:MAG TPA: LysM peptidoglycan-binding domain-containing protein [Kiritimatiellia bacterium]|nr:LysM peptidoglycan-binding domain-containing protein [Kiritimatiellia bacterium]